MPASGAALAVVDSGPLYAAADEDDAYHAIARATLGRADLSLLIPALVVAEVTFMIGRRIGAVAEAAFLRGLAGFDVQPPKAAEWPRIAQLVEKYKDFPLGGTDASVVALAERLRTPFIVTFDRRHFAALRPRHGGSFRLLPEAL